MALQSLYLAASIQKYRSLPCPILSVDDVQYVYGAAAFWSEDAQVHFESVMFLHKPLCMALPNMNSQKTRGWHPKLDMTVTLILQDYLLAAMSLPLLDGGEAGQMSPLQPESMPGKATDLQVGISAAPCCRAVPSGRLKRA
jgi:hypothetical protein